MMAREHFDSSCLCDNPTRTTPQLDPAPWDGEALATAFETMDELDARLRGGEMRCWSCHAAPEPILYRVDGHWVCGQCAIECAYCAERPVVASARRPADDPTAPGQVDMLCAECLHEHWAPGETLQGAYLCLECDEWHVREQDCCACHGDGWFDRDEDTEYGAVAVAQHCDCPAGVRLSEQADDPWKRPVFVAPEGSEVVCHVGVGGAVVARGTGSDIETATGAAVNAWQRNQAAVEGRTA